MAENIVIERVLVKIDKQTSNKDKEKVRFVAAAIFPHLSDCENKETPYNIYDRLENKYGKKAAALYKRLLECSCLQMDPKYIQALEPYIEEEVNEELPNGILSRQELLNRCRDLEDNPELLKHFVAQFESEELGMATADINSHVQLLQLLCKDVKPFDVLLEMVESRLSTALSLHTTSPTGPASQNQQTQHLVTGLGASNVQSGHPPAVQKDRQERTKKCILASVICGFLLFVILTVFVGFSGKSGHLSNQVQQLSMTLYKNITILVARTPLNIQFNNRIRFSFTRSFSPSPMVQVCYFDCTNELPRVRRSYLNVSFSSMRSSSTVRRLVQFEPTDDVNQTSIFMLADSTVIFSAVAEVPIVLHIFNDLYTCGLFLRGNNHPSFRNFTLKESNNYSVKFTVPSYVDESYYCGVWVVSPNVTFQYFIDASISVYDVDFYYSELNDHAKCSNPLPNNLERMTEYDLHFQVTILERYMCVLLAQLIYESEVSADVHVHTTTRNPLFGVLAAFGTLSLVSFLFSLTVCLYCICVCCRQFCLQREVEKSKL